MSKGAVNWFWIIVGLLVILVVTKTIDITGFLGGAPGVPTVTTTPTAAGGFGQLVSLSVKGVDKYTGSAIGVNGELWSSTDSQYAAETSVASALTSLGTTFPNSFDGYVILGNDNYESTSDRGTEYYYVKYLVSWYQQGLKTYDNIETVAEETATTTSLWTFYDDGTAETTANITIGSGGTYTAASVKLMSSSNLCTGNPHLNSHGGKKAIGICFNESTSGMFKEIKLNKNSGSIPIPGFLAGKNVVSCWQFTNALCDGNYETSDLYFEANSGQDPGVTDKVYAMPIDLCYYKNDASKWVVGYGDESDLAADTDCGINSMAAYQLIYLA